MRIVEKSTVALASRIAGEAGMADMKYRRVYSPEFTVSGGDGTVFAFSLYAGRDAIDYRAHRPDGRTETGTVTAASSGESVRALIERAVRQMTGEDADRGGPMLMVPETSWWRMESGGMLDIGTCLTPQLAALRKEGKGCI